ncbi:MAG: ferrous iron transport protein B [Bacteroidetes bacterium GWC2_33_15]|nr:MAG: ferrous iron transport protein B [Bacteroidetes bacterium GWA2_33_15]OFX51108.1 MAG: ferrous iron transport protein B [Bacteroidetes bacterium GWC2_33_15]OFX66458.1 MAG: ferrous iron transport protein B [Bacteroidetes bacterium GWB2_32_14]OFX70316.1 MAG: ferrous iron transport protein B [Bacteroidetes bacterium GWD2_33_33]HAN17318.1 ferrous iron transport protein B [Bacteroidales bacterium]
MKLSQLKDKDEGYITKVRGRGAFRKRITEMGFVKGKKIVVVKNAPLKDPIEYSIMGYEVSLRKSEAALIEVITKEEAQKLDINKFNGVITEETLKTSAKSKGNEIQVALVGNPNSGKTTLFNFASRSREHVGNYSGVTVDSKTAHFKLDDYSFNITDLPGTYSLSAYSPEELFVRKFILKEIPDVVINVVDASNLERNLYLTTQLIDMDIKVVIALNMYDELKQKGDDFDFESLGKMIGIPIIPTISSKGYGIKTLFKKVIDVYEDNDPSVRHIHINYGKDVEQSIHNIQEVIWKNERISDTVSSRYYAIKLLEKDSSAKRTLSTWENYTGIKSVAEKEIKKIESLLQEDSETIITDSKYGFIAGALKETYKGNINTRRKKTEQIDHFLTHKYLGFPIFIFFMWFMFQATFSLGQYPMDWIDKLVLLFSNFIHTIMPNGALKDLLINGIIGGVGGVIVFLPNILILFFFISLMEDTGYMARTAFIMDRIMHKIGLHGRSFIPLIMGFGCNVPAIMATRTIENRHNRILTMLINPFMSCSARLPVYVLIISAFFPNHPGTVLFSIYAIGIIVAALMAILFKKTIFKSNEVPFVMELPPYRVPTIKNTLRHMWHKGAQYLQKMGGVILIASIIIWALGYYPKNVNYAKNYDNEINIAKNNQALNQEQKSREINKLITNKNSEKQASSYIGQIGKFIEPIMRPLGFDWKMSVSLLSGVAAKEIVVSTMGVLYQAGTNGNDIANNLSIRLQNDRNENGDLNFSPLIAYGFLIFILLYFPCVASIAAIKKESGHWKWALFTVVYTTFLAWLFAFAIYQIGSLII